MKFESIISILSDFIYEYCLQSKRYSEKAKRKLLKQIEALEELTSLAHQVVHLSLSVDADDLLAKGISYIELAQKIKKMIF